MSLACTKLFRWAACALLMFAAPLFSAYAEAPTAAPPPNCPLAPPTSLTISDVGVNSLTANWSAVPGALMYKVTVKNLNTNLIIATVYTSNTSQFISGLPSNTPLRVGVSASSCNTPNPANFGNEKTAETRTLKYIVNDVIVNKCELHNNSRPWTTTNLSIPVNFVGDDYWNYYQAKVTGTQKGADWTCRFSIVVTCTDNTSGTGFYVFIDSDETTPNVTYTQNTALDQVQFMVQNANVFTIQNAIVFSSSQLSASTDIILLGSISSFSSIQCDEQPKPEGFGCLSSDSGFGSGNEDRDAQGGLAAPTKHSASLSPNPTSDQVDLQFHLTAASEVAVTLHDAAGRPVQQVTPPQAMPEGQNRLALDVSALPPGFYWVQLRSTQGMETLPLVKQ